MEELLQTLWVISGVSLIGTFFICNLVKGGDNWRESDLEEEYVRFDR